jgi:DNA-binding MltR family transcriptional regulator
MEESTDEILEKSDDFKGFYEELGKESDRAVALVAAAFLDTMLRGLLTAFMVDDEKAVASLIGDDDGGQDKPLSILSSKISASYCLGLISKEERDDLNLIRRIRNKFAHGLHGMSFQDSEIVSYCSSLKFTRRLMSGKSMSPRNHFTMTAALMSSDIKLKTLSVGDSKRKIVNDKEIVVLFDNIHESDS